MKKFLPLFIAATSLVTSCGNVDMESKTAELSEKLDEVTTSDVSKETTTAEAKEEYSSTSTETTAAAETEKAMSPLNDVEGKDIIIDCTDLAYIASAGLRIFLGILQSAQEKGGHVYIKGINDSVRAVFTITGFSNIFEFK